MAKRTTSKSKSPKSPAKKRTTGQKILRFFWLIFLWFNIISFLVVLLFKFVPVPFTPLMGMRALEHNEEGKDMVCSHEWVPIDEISLNLQMLIEVLTINRMYILATKPNNCIKFYTYIVARAFKLLLLIKAINEDYFIEFKEDLETLGNLFLSYEHLMKHAIYNGLDVNWLLDAEIPENIVAIHKEIRANGFLK